MHLAARQLSGVESCKAHCVTALKTFRSQSDTQAYTHRMECLCQILTEPTCDAPTDTLHRFCKKEHDWGWKKFMELSKVLEGFTVEDTLIIKAQVQVIRCARRHIQHTGHSKQARKGTRSVCTGRHQ